MNADGDTPVADFLMSLSDKEYDKCMYYLRILVDNGPRLPTQYAKHIDGGLWELRPEFGGQEMRVFYFAWVDNLLVILHGCKKSGKKAFQREIKTAFARMEEIKS
jgi:phage-related protein